MQLVAYGAQDIYLTGNPQITFFKVVYRRHTNFSMETIQQTIDGSSVASSSSTNTGTVVISRNGDLVTKVYVRVSSDAGYNTGDGNDIVNKVDLEIGGQLIDRHYAEWMKVWNELSTPSSKCDGLKSMTGGEGHWGDTGEARYNTGVNYCHIPLSFWFCRNPGLALPLIALQYHEVKLKFTWGSLVIDNNCSVWCDYIYLDTDERRRFAQVSHEYLIEQVQKQTGSLSSSHDLNFNHPVKELIWTETTITQTRDNETKLVLNGHDRFSKQVQEYFILRQPYEHHTSIPSCNLPIATGYHSGDHCKYVTGFNVKTGTSGNSPEADDADEKYTWKWPAHSEITSIDIYAAGGVVLTSGGDIGYSVGTSALGVDIVAAVTDQILDNGTGVTKGAMFGPLTLVAVAESDTTAAASVLMNDTDDFKTLHFNITTTQAATVGTTGPFTFIIHFRYLPHNNFSFGHKPARTSTYTGLINCYSFALKPEEHQPSGTCNFSRIDSAQLQFIGGTSPTIANIYAVNYNVLRIMSGMGGLAYSN